MRRVLDFLIANIDHLRQKLRSRFIEHLLDQENVGETTLAKLLTSLP